MQIYRKYLLALIIVLLLAVNLFSAKGVVTHKPSNCDYCIVETKKGYAILEWYGGNDPDKGDVIVGDFESYGMKNIYNATSEAELRVWVEDFWLDKEDALEKLFDECN